ncbi:MAG: radical SAM protein [Spirochaetales bacterium]|jgi:spore photoproduct lyase|nr:radical SAM protein [Spirochaetales bacterium]
MIGGEGKQALLEDSLFVSLPSGEQNFLREQAAAGRLTFQELRILRDLAADFRLWGEPGVAELWAAALQALGPRSLPGREEKRRAVRAVQERWERLKEEGPRYGPSGEAPEGEAAGPWEKGGGTEKPPEESPLALGPCPVASEKTRCCGLLTLDAVSSCACDCSYCTIQSFYHGGRIAFRSCLEADLRALEKTLPPGPLHIGTGQSSDSLLWGNHRGLLDSLLDFAARNPRVILEFKTKTANVDPLLNREIPPNLIVTFTLNTPAVIEHEERRTADLGERLKAASRLARRGVLVGFHFHPLIRYQGWEGDYRAVFRQLKGEVSPASCALVSLGTLTFIRPVIRRIRERGRPTQVLKMPWTETAGKLSYPREVKRELFSLAWEELGDWREEVFVYLCMEDPALWQEVFGWDYPDNRAFEEGMKRAYLAKIARRL